MYLRVYGFFILGVLVLLNKFYRTIHKLSSVSSSRGVGRSVKSRMLVISILGLCGIPCSLIFIVKSIAILFLRGQFWVLVILITSFFSVLIYSRLFIFRWARAASRGVRVFDFR